MNKSKKILDKIKLWTKRSMTSLAFAVYILFSKMNMIVIQAADKKKDDTGDTGITKINDGINVLKMLAKGIISGIGFYILLLGIVDLGTGLSEHNATQQHEGVKKVFAGLIVCGAPWIITAMGIA